MLTAFKTAASGSSRFLIATVVAIGALLTVPVAAHSQQTYGTVTVRAVADGAPVVEARASAAGVVAATDGNGVALLRLPGGRHTLRVTHVGYEMAVVPIIVRAQADTVIVVELEREAVEIEAIIVSSTRTERRIEDEPVRVEVIGREEVEEKLLMTPGDISMLLNETAGLRVQPTAPALGGAGVRIQGLRGRYTQILSDGLPLNGGQTGALGPLQIPPMDLAQVEVIKGAASALYGASAVGGVVNLISRRPGAEHERELLLNQSTLDGTDGILWSSGPVTGAVGYTVLAGAHRQGQADPDDDGWADLPSYRRASVRPRLFWNDARGSSAVVTAGAMVEDREGGMLDGGSNPTAYVESLDTRRFDAGIVARRPVSAATHLSMRAATALQSHRHRFDDAVDDDAHTTGFVELAVIHGAGAHTLLGGAVVQADDYDVENLDGFDYTYTVPGLFAQHDFAPASWLALSSSARLDHHSTYGAFLSPRISVLVRPAEQWSVRASAGTGYFAPTPWTDETESVGLRRVVPPQGLDAERARTASLDIGRTIGPLELNGTLFGSSISRPVQARSSADPALLELFNADAPVRTYGTELLARFHVEGLHVTATHVYLRATEADPAGSGRRAVPLSPRHTAGMVAAWEQEGRSRVGVELYYTGRQDLEDNPYRSVSEPYFVVGFLAERRFGPARFFINAENILDERQTRHDPLVLPSRSAVGRWTTDVWGPLEGRAFNGGVRLTF